MEGASATARTPHEGIKERFGTPFLRLSHPSGLQLEVIEDASDQRNGWTTEEITSDVTTRGFHGPVLSVREVGETERFFVDALGFKRPARTARTIVSRWAKAARPRP